MEINNEFLNIEFETQKVLYPRYSMGFVGQRKTTEFAIVQAELKSSQITLPDGSVFGPGDIITLKGNGLPLNRELAASMAIPEKDPKTKRWVFKVANVVLKLNLEEVDNVKELLTRYVKGVSDKTADAIIEHFGEDAMDILLKDPARLGEVKGIKGKRVALIKEQIFKLMGQEGAAKALLPIGVPLWVVTAINAHYGIEKGLDVCMNKPYSLCKVPQVDFPTAHLIRQRLGIEGQDEAMYAFAIEYILNRMEMTGSSIYSIQDVISDVIDVIGREAGEFDRDQFVKSIDVIERRGIVIVNWQKGNIGLKSLLDKEKYVFDTYMNVLHNRTKRSYKDVVKTVSKKNRVNLHHKQASAIEILLNHKYGILTGGPGTGKTTVLQCFIESFESVSGGAKVLCLAPTGRAASRMGEATGRPAYTVHKRLGLKPDEIDVPDDMVLDYDLVVVDESSMLDINITYALLKSLSPRTRLVLVGDKDQLPSVGAGAVLSDLIDGGYVGVARLTKTFRQGADSSIIANAQMINAGQSDLITSADDYAEILAKHDEAGLKTLIDTYLREAQTFGENNVVALLPKRKAHKGRFTISVESVNPIIQEALNPYRKGLLTRRNLQYTFRKGDRVMQMKNTDTVMNGDVGIITDMVLDAGVVCAKVDFGYEGAESVYYATDEDFNSLSLAYATTIHKSQGSEYPCVITPLFSEDGVMLQRNLFYTAVTRAKKKMVFIGEKEAAHQAVISTDAFKRNTYLKALFTTARKQGIPTISEWSEGVA